MTLNLSSASGNLDQYVVLIIEDNASSRLLASTVLQQEGYRVLVAPDGETGLALAKEHLPNVIVCDIMMPELDGYMVLERLHSQSSTATIPFIFLTALSQSADIREGMGLGADDYLTKPYHAADLVRAVGTRLRRNERLRAEQYERFAQQLVQIQENEQQRMAAILNDHVNQALMGLRLSLNLLETGSTRNDPIYTDARNQLDALINVIDNVAQQMHPTMLSRLEFVSAVRWLVGQYDLDITLSVQNMDYKFDAAAEIAAFRIIQLAMDNIVRHAKTRALSMELAYRDSMLEIRIEHHGAGFELDSSRHSYESVNLLSMYQHASIVGGQVNIRSSPEQGTFIIVQIPQDDAAHQSRPSPQSVLMNASSRGQVPTPQAATDQEIRLMIATEQPLLRQGLRRLLSGSPRLVLLADTGDLASAAATIKKYRPDVLIINPVVEGKKQHEVLQAIVSSVAETHVLVIAASTDPEYVVDAILNGALGYVPVNATMTDLNTAIVNVARGQLYLSPTIRQEEVMARLPSTGGNN